MRTYVYVDGQNLYHEIKRLCSGQLSGLPDQWSAYQWLDVRKLSQQTLSNCQILNVNYYSAPLNYNSQKPKARSDQKIYWDALSASKVKVDDNAYFQRKRCNSCRMDSSEEKRSDVNLACDMILDAFHNKYDLVVLIAADADYVRPLEILTQSLKKKTCLFLMGQNLWRRNQGRRDDNLTKIVDSIRNITLSDLRNSRLPDPVICPGTNRLIHRPKH